MTDSVSEDVQCLGAAARLAARGRGRAEPNPLVGCVITKNNNVIGWGYHAYCGGPHAEIEALRRAGTAAHGATAYVTLEPCNHTGRTGPCTQAIIDAGINRVVIAQRDPNPIASGGLDVLERAGIAITVTDACPVATNISSPFVYRVKTGLPWVIAKWAQTVDGKLATSTGDSKWISSNKSRQAVHRCRARVDAILTGVGTVLHDDPLLTARNVRVRRVARRIVLDPNLDIPTESTVVRTAKEIPTVVWTSNSAKHAARARCNTLERAGVNVVGTEMNGVNGPLSDGLRHLAKTFDITNILVEAGGRLLASLISQNLANEAWVFLAPMLLADQQAVGLSGPAVAKISDAWRLKLISTHRRDDDIEIRYGLNGFGSPSDSGETSKFTDEGNIRKTPS